MNMSCQTKDLSQYGYLKCFGVICDDLKERIPFVIHNQNEHIFKLKIFTPPAITPCP